MATRVFFSPGPHCWGQIVERFLAARESVDVCVFTITDDRIKQAMLVAHRRGVRIRVISDNDKSLDRGSDIEELADAGIPVRLDETEYHMHHKFAIFDGRFLLNGSYNWTRGAADVNEENIVDTDDPEVLRPFQAEFERLWKQLG